ncbi:transmembrane protein, putative (macronuclear) [Tetrahymena thermophila SB210]|uniref:Transmembrane protein, putative n=1 Tax=Tetrahymena thermophila (strain SB210) TaxID=312017 RepID=Q23U67_TETTS|nr:transmembrane protein, putative [Tetrahymena thermophila SB210]EAS00077.2 transmembrane protein, putative [Tetrahymena thermophila SB210]|eukprot:XP_001020322.2 transmembrane protein, putative [Tetrahymena thermophila SB210]
MNQRKNNLNLIIASVVIILGCSQAFASKVTIPLKQNKDGAIFFPVQYGSQKCEVNVFPVFNQDCYNIISSSSHQTNLCGAQYIGVDSYTNQPNYSTEFQLGNVKANLLFVSPDNEQIEKRQLCFSYQQFKQDNVIVELFEDKLIQNQITYINLNSTTLQNVGDDMIVGSLEIGEPDASLIKQDYSFVELAVYTIPDKQFYSSYCRGAVYSGYPLGAHVYAHFNIDSPFTQLPSESVNQILKIFDQDNIKYRVIQVATSKHADIVLSSVDKLQPLYIYLQRRYGKIYTITLQPYQLYRQLRSGEYQLLIQQQSDDLNYIAFGNTIFDTYYLGFDFQNHSVQIVEKAQKQKTSNFRGSQIMQ